jgi:hypothetical protein
LTAPAIGAWRNQLPAGSAHYIHRSLRQVLAYGVRCKYLHDNAAALVPNPRPRFALARRMGTSLEMIDKTNGHLAPDADEYELGLLDAFDARISEAGGRFLDTAD